MNKEKNSCPSAVAFEELCFNQRSDEEKKVFIDHIFSCPQCRIKFQALHSLKLQLNDQEGEFAQEGLTAAENKAFRKMGRQRLRELRGGKIGGLFSLSSPARRFVVAASVLLLILGGFLLFGPLSQKNSFRDSGSRPFRLIEPKGIIENPPARFVWIPCVGADTYYFKIIDEDLETIIEKGTQETSIALDAANQNKLKRGKKYIWSIEAWAEDNTPLSVARDYFLIK